VIVGTVAYMINTDISTEWLGLELGLEIGSELGLELGSKLGLELGFS
jgi:hypothetical protein